MSDYNRVMLDSINEGVFTVGCAGGKDTHLSVPVEEEALPGSSKVFKLVAGGMSDGVLVSHST